MYWLPAQCVMCFRTASAQQLARSAVFNQGILILLIAPLVVVSLISFLVWKSLRTDFGGGTSVSGKELSEEKQSHEWEQDVLFDG